MKRNIIKLNEIGSTNDYMRKYALADDDEMAVTVASYQTAGRGQGTILGRANQAKTYSSL